MNIDQSVKMATPFVNPKIGCANANRVAEALKYLPLNDEKDFFGRAAANPTRSQSSDLQDPFEEDDDGPSGPTLAQQRTKRVSLNIEIIFTC